MKGCELCNSPARMYCESDQASLCWDCDVKVHCANFLVARHSRSLLCHVCQSPTPWKASGAKIGPTVSICERCVNDDAEEIDGDHEDDDEERGNQVVPWSSTPPPPVASPSSSEESSNRLFSGGGGVAETAMRSSLKRTRENADLGSQDDLGNSSSQPNNDTARVSADDEATSFRCFRSSKDRNRVLTIRSAQAALVDSLKRFQKDILDSRRVQTKQ